MTSRGNPLSIQYVFASDEYNEFVGQFNDVFALFLDGENIALVPGTSERVGINTINTSTNPSLFQDNDFPTGVIDLEYDGLTTVLTATKAGLTDGSTHTLKLVVADVFDFSIDSAIFVGRVQVLPVPEPKRLVQQLFAVGVLVFLARRSKRSV